MRSVKKFLNERMNSVEITADTAQTNTKKAGPDKLKRSSADKQHTCNCTSDEYISLPSTPLQLTAPIAASDPSPSPSPSVAESGQNTPLCTLEEDFNVSLPATASSTNGGVGASPIESSAFNFSPTTSAAIIQPAPQRKSRRKISLPWFRQSSVCSHGALSRQHTIDTPSSFRFFRQPSNSGFKLGSQETTWVVADYIANTGSNELSVSKGQQVDIIEPPTANEPDFCIVRLNPQNDEAAAQEGLVPVAVLKPPPTVHKQGTAVSATLTTMSSTQKPTDGVQDSGNRGKSDPLSSSTKRRGFSGRKWLPPPLRKLSQSKVDKPPPEKLLIKKPSEKSLRLPQKQSEDVQQQSSGATNPGGLINSQYSTAQHVDYEPEEEAGLELPPPMKPIQEPHLIANVPPAFSKDLKESSANVTSSGKLDGNPLSEIEQIVREKTEQHESKNRGDGSCGLTETPSTNGRTHSGIEMKLASNSKDQEKNAESLTDISESKVSALRKRQCALAELVSTEESYVQDLQEIVNGYIPETSNPNSDIPLPNDLKGGKKKLVFNNIKEIYEWHRDYFLKELRNCQKSPADLGPLIKSSERKFTMYYYYCSNKPLSEFIVSAHFQYFDQIRQKLGHRLDLSNLIIKPVQRITKYELLLKEITKQTERAGLFKEVAILKEAYQQMKVVVKTVNDMMIVLRSLQGFEGEITAQGNLLLQGPLTCMIDAGQKQRELQVFLFQQTIIFADIEKAKTQFSNPTFKYRSHIQVNNMQMKKLGDNRFLLKSTAPNRPDLDMVCQAATLDRYVEWVDKLDEILDKQKDFMIAISSPIEYQNKMKTQK